MVQQVYHEEITKGSAAMRIMRIAAEPYIHRVFMIFCTGHAIELLHSTCYNIIDLLCRFVPFFVSEALPDV